MKNILSVKAQERTTQSSLLYPSAVGADYPYRAPKADCPTRAPSAERLFFQSKQTFGGFIPTRWNWACRSLEICRNFLRLTCGDWRLRLYDWEILLVGKVVYCKAFKVKNNLISIKFFWVYHIFSRIYYWRFHFKYKKYRHLSNVDVTKWYFIRRKRCWRILHCHSFTIFCCQYIW